ncbi:TPA: hypothetical protein ACGN07_005884 [Bacillus cereus]
MKETKNDDVEVKLQELTENKNKRFYSREVFSEVLKADLGKIKEDVAEMKGILQSVNKSIDNIDITMTTTNRSLMNNRLLEVEASLKVLEDNKIPFTI